MSETAKIDNLGAAIKYVCDLARPYLSAEYVARVKRRHAAMFRWEQADYLPLLYWKNVPELERLGCYAWDERWHEPAKSFLEQMKGVVQAAASGSDVVPAVRADTGVINGPALFGAGYAIPPHTRPVVNRRVPKAELAAFVLPEDITPLGVTPRILEHTQHHLQALRENGLEGLVGVHHPDTQGPFDIAAQARGHDIFTDFYDDPGFVHHLMEQSTRAYVALSRLCKRLQGEGETWGNASGLWMDPGGVRLCDDSGILVSAASFQTFLEPYYGQAFEPFGGGWLHYCGGVPGGGRPEGLHLHDCYLRIPRLRGLNFTTGRDLAAEIRKLTASRIVYYGGYPRQKDEDLAAYFRRVLQFCPGRTGLIFTPEIRPEEADGFMLAWRKAQDELFA